MVTSNHIHLLIKDTGGNVIAQSMQLIAGRTAQDYNQRKGMLGVSQLGKLSGREQNMLTV
jgi:putative transposase